MENPPEIQILNKILAALSSASASSRSSSALSSFTLINAIHNQADQSASPSSSSLGSFSTFDVPFDAAKKLIKEIMKRSPWKEIQELEQLVLGGKQKKDWSSSSGEPEGKVAVVENRTLLEERIADFLLGILLTESKGGRSSKSSPSDSKIKLETTKRPQSSFLCQFQLGHRLPAAPLTANSPTTFTLDYKKWLTKKSMKKYDFRNFVGRENLIDRKERVRKMSNETLCKMIRKTPNLDPPKKQALVDYIQSIKTSELCHLGQEKLFPIQIFGEDYLFRIDPKRKTWEILTSEGSSISRETNLIAVTISDRTHKLVENLIKTQRDGIVFRLDGSICENPEVTTVQTPPFLSL